MPRRPSNPIVSFLLNQREKLSRLLILTHNHPDPDAIASAWALAYLAQHLCGIRSRIVYGGIIARMENRTLVRILRVPIRPFQPKDLANDTPVALVDTQPPFQNNPFPARRRPKIVIDHHPRHAKTTGDFVFIDEEVGATTTLVSEALLTAGVEVPSRLATALIYGIGSETQNLGRETDARDVSAYRTFFPKARMWTLSKIQNPPRPRSFFQTLGKAIHQAFVMNRVIGAHLGSVPSQDVVAHMADFLLTHERISWSMVTGRYKGRLYVSLRTRNPRAKAGRLLWRLLGSGTSGGGHDMIAGGSIGVGENASERNWGLAERRLMSSFLRSQGYKEPFEFQYPYRGKPTR